jgi:hypothetical protein
MAGDANSPNATDRSMGAADAIWWFVASDAGRLGTIV